MVRGLLRRGCWLGGNNINDNFNLNANEYLNNTNASRGIACLKRIFFMKIEPGKYLQLCSYKNLFLAYKKARKRKTQRREVLDFEKDLENNILLLRTELLLHAYRPKPLTSFVIRDPKTRKISKSTFRDRIVHHALCNIIAPIFESGFIHDSYANQIGKGTLKAIERFDNFKKRASKNNTKACFVLKADIKHYFENVDHLILLKIIKKKIKDDKIIWLMKTILDNYSSGEKGRGMPLGNLTSQFLANVYLNELDQFVKHQLKVEYYLRYVDDFVILDDSLVQLNSYFPLVNSFLYFKLHLELHPNKSKILPLSRGIKLLGFRNFYYHKLIPVKRLNHFKRKFHWLRQLYLSKKVSYDQIYNFIEGWLAYAKHADTYSLRQKVLAELEQKFSSEISVKEVNRYLIVHTFSNPPPSNSSYQKP